MANSSRSTHGDGPEACCGPVTQLGGAAWVRSQRSRSPPQWLERRRRHPRSTPSRPRDRRESPDWMGPRMVSSAPRSTDRWAPRCRCRGSVQAGDWQSQPSRGSRPSLRLPATSRTSAFANETAGLDRWSSLRSGKNSGYLAQVSRVVIVPGLPVLPTNHPLGSRDVRLRQRLDPLAVLVDGGIEIGSAESNWRVRSGLVHEPLGQAGAS